MSTYWKQTNKKNEMPYLKWELHIEKKKKKVGVYKSLVFPNCERN